MINKLYEILENAPRDKVDCELIGGYTLAEYLYNNGVRFIHPAHWVRKDVHDYYCSHCASSSKDPSPRFCPSCGAQILAEVSICLDAPPPGVPLYISVKIPPFNIRYVGKRSAKKKTYKKNNQ